MKKILLFAFALSILSITSCTKEYMCTCKNSDGDTWDNVYQNALTQSEADAKKLECEADSNCTFDVSKYPY